MKISKVGLLFLLKIALIICEINGDKTQVPTDIVVQVQEILVIFKHWINNNGEEEDNEDFIIQFKEFGKRIAQILSLIPEHNIWWLWQLSILSNSIDIFYQNLNHSKTTQFILNSRRISNSIQLINNQIELNLLSNENLENEIINKLNNIYTSWKYKIENIEPIDHIPLKLDKLDKIIKTKFEDVNDNTVNSYTPQNLFLFDIILNNTSINSLFTECSDIEWGGYKKYLIKSYRKAINVWVDENEMYVELINYRKVLIGAVKLSIYIHVKICMSVLRIYGMDKNNGNNNELNLIWNALKILINEFIQLFHLQDDFYLNEIYNLLNSLINGYPEPNYYMYRIYDYAYKEFKSYECFESQYINIEQSYMYKKIYGNDLIRVAQNNLQAVQIYFNQVKNIFNNVDFKSYKIFCSIIP